MSRFWSRCVHFPCFVAFWFSETGQIWGFRAFSGDRMGRIAWNVSCWCILTLTTFRTDYISIMVCWVSLFFVISASWLHAYMTGLWRLRGTAAIGSLDALVSYNVRVDLLIESGSPPSSTIFDGNPWLIIFVNIKQRKNKFWYVTMVIQDYL